MLGRLEMDVDECISAYNDLMREVFQNNVFERVWQKIYMAFTFKIAPQFDSKKLESAIKKVIQKNNPSDSDPIVFNDGKQRNCRV